MRLFTAFLVMLPLLLFVPTHADIVGDAVGGARASMTAGSNILTDSDALFSAAAVGKSVVVKGAGASGDDLISTIASVDSRSRMRLAGPASNSVSGAAYAFGTDNTSAIQASLDKFSAHGGIVDLPAGNYLCLGHLKVPDYTTLRGINGFWCHAGFVDGVPHTYPQDGGTTLWVTEKGSTSFIDAWTDSTVEGICFFYPLQMASQAVPTPYPWTIEGNSGHRNINVRNVELLNSYQGIRVAGKGNPERVLLDGVSGQPIAFGVSLDDIWDVCRVSNCHFNPWWSGLKSPIFAWQQANGVAFDISKADWSFGVNDAAIGYMTDFWFGRGLGATGTWTNCDADMCRYAVVCNGIDRAIGLNLVGWKFTANDPHGVAILLTDGCSGAVTIADSDFAAVGERVLQVGAGDPFVCLANNHIDNWGGGGPSSAVYAKSGVLRCTGNYFGGNVTAPQVELEPGVKKAIVSDNLAAPGATFNVKNGIGDRAGISGNL